MAPTNLLLLLIAIIALINPSSADDFGHLPPAQSPKPGRIPPYFGRPPKGHVEPPLPARELPLIPYAPGPVVLPPHPPSPPNVIYHGQFSAQPPIEGHPGHFPPAQSPKPGPKRLPPYFGRPPKGHVEPPLSESELPLIPYAPGPVVLPPLPASPPNAIYHGHFSAQPPIEGHHGHFPPHPPKEGYPGHFPAHPPEEGHHGHFPAHPPEAGPHGHIPFPF